jgi:molecular chaperone HtpG
VAQLGSMLFGSVRPTIVSFRVMDIIINSLYSDKDVFLRELVSNAADACDKKRFLSITADGEAADTTDYRIRIKADRVR